MTDPTPSWYERAQAEVARDRLRFDTRRFEEYDLVNLKRIMLPSAYAGLTGMLPGDYEGPYGGRASWGTLAGSAELFGRIGEGEVDPRLAAMGYKAGDLTLGGQQQRQREHEFGATFGAGRSDADRLFAEGMRQEAEKQANADRDWAERMGVDPNTVVGGRQLPDYLQAHGEWARQFYTQNNRQLPTYTDLVRALAPAGRVPEDYNPNGQGQPFAGQIPAAGPGVARNLDGSFQDLVTGQQVDQSTAGNLIRNRQGAAIGMSLDATGQPVYQSPAGQQAAGIARQPGPGDRMRSFTEMGGDPRQLFDFQRQAGGPGGGPGGDAFPEMGRFRGGGGGMDATQQRFADLGRQDLYALGRGVQGSQRGFGGGGGEGLGLMGAGGFGGYPGGDVGVGGAPGSATAGISGGRPMSEFERRLREEGRGTDIRANLEARGQNLQDQWTQNEQRIKEEQNLRDNAIQQGNLDLARQHEQNTNSLAERSQALQEQAQRFKEETEAAGLTGTFRGSDTLAKGDLMGFLNGSATLEAGVALGEVGGRATLEREALYGGRAYVPGGETLAERQRQDQAEQARRQLLAGLRGPEDIVQYARVAGGTPGGINQAVDAALGRYRPAGYGDVGGTPQPAGAGSIGPGGWNAPGGGGGNAVMGGGGGRQWGVEQPGSMYAQVEGPGNPSWERRNPQANPAAGGGGANQAFGQRWMGGPGGIEPSWGGGGRSQEQSSGEVMQAMGRLGSTAPNQFAWQNIERLPGSTQVQIRALAEGTGRRPEDIDAAHAQALGRYRGPRRGRVAINPLGG